MRNVIVAGNRVAEQPNKKNEEPPLIVISSSLMREGRRGEAQIR